MPFRRSQKKELWVCSRSSVGPGSPRARLPGKLYRRQRWCWEQCIRSIFGSGLQRVRPVRQKQNKVSEGHRPMVCQAHLAYGSVVLWSRRRNIIDARPCVPQRFQFRITRPPRFVARRGPSFRRRSASRRLPFRALIGRLRTRRGRSEFGGRDGFGGGDRGRDGFVAARDGGRSPFRFALRNLNNSFLVNRRLQLIAGQHLSCHVEAPLRINIPQARGAIPAWRLRCGSSTWHRWHRAPFS